jgi:hypothetical protein
MRSTLRRLIIVITVGALLAPAAASARLLDDPPIKAQPAQDLRSPDTRDVAEGRGLGTSSPTSSLAGTTAAPSQPSQPVAPAGGGVDWPSLAIGAALFGGLVLVAFGIAGVRRVRPRPVS